jgi:hypothetical protein
MEYTVQYCFADYLMIIYELHYTSSVILFWQLCSHRVGLQINYMFLSERRTLGLMFTPHTIP